MGNGSKNRQTLVMKFGGTSVGSVEAIDQVIEIVAQAHVEWSRLVLVTSALSGVTNLLLDSASSVVNRKLADVYHAADSLRDRHYRIVDRFIHDSYRNGTLKQELERLIGEFVNLCQAISVLGESTPRAIDAIGSLGERLSVRLLSGVLDVNGIPSQPIEATRLIVTDAHFQSAHPDFLATQEKSQQVIEPLLIQGVVPVITGFIAATPEGITTTLGRGGSDYSAAILGCVLPADEVWIWTDVDGVMSADPRLVPDAHTIPELTYREISELAYYGAKVVHPKTIRPIIDSAIGLRVCNTFHPAHPGTRLVPDQEKQTNGAIKAVTAIPRQSLITIEGRGMLGVPGVAARAFGAVAATGTSVPLITQASSEQSICFAVPGESTVRVVSALEASFSSELASRDIDSIWAMEDVVIVTVVGAGMRHTPGIAGRIFGTLGQCGVNVIAIAQGSSEVSISLVVEGSEAERAVRGLHELTNHP